MLLLTLILFIGSSFALYLRPEVAVESKQDHPLMYVVTVQELVNGPPVSVPDIFAELEQKVVKKQLYIYGESVMESEEVNPSPLPPGNTGTKEEGERDRRATGGGSTDVIEK